MNLQHRINLLGQLGEYILANEAGWQQAKEEAGYQNGWFIPEFVESATRNIGQSFLQKDLLENWIAGYKLPSPTVPKKIGIVMAGNIPLVGFHDLLCTFVSGHHAVIKPSTRDEVLVKHLAGQLATWDDRVNEMILFSEMLKNCDAYIATGSNNSSRYFEYYFRKFPHIIRRNKTSVALLTGRESRQELELLADDVYLYFGLGCRNVTKIYVPAAYDFVPLLEAFRKYNYLGDHHKYKNNYDYNLAINLLNKKYYMSNESLLLIEEPGLYSPISQLNYEFYHDREKLTRTLEDHPDLQCIVGQDHTPFGRSQSPGLGDYADGVDTLAFLADL
jgi:hypothetical protein